MIPRRYRFEQRVRRLIKRHPTLSLADAIECVRNVILTKEDGALTLMRELDPVADDFMYPRPKRFDPELALPWGGLFIHPAYINQLWEWNK